MNVMVVRVQDRLSVIVFGSERMSASGMSPEWLLLQERLRKRPSAIKGTDQPHDPTKGEGTPRGACPEPTLSQLDKPPPHLSQRYAQMVWSEDN